MNPSNPTDATGTAATVAIIGRVESAFVDVAGRTDYRAESRVRLSEEFASGLLGLEYFSHIWVIYRQHRAEEWLKARAWAPGGPLVIPADDERCGQGIFCSRAPCRPARLGSCIVRLLRREGAVLVVSGLDAIDGTPVIDVKPYVPRFDAFADATIPLHWARVMDGEDDHAHGSRAFHWDTTQRDFALGQRVGLAALAAFGAHRGVGLQAEVRGSLFFAQGFEMTSGCTPLRGSLRLEEASAAAGPWTILVKAKSGRKHVWSMHPPTTGDAAAVFAAPEHELWSIDTAPDHPIKLASS